MVNWDYWKYPIAAGIIAMVVTGGYLMMKKDNYGKEHFLGWEEYKNKEYPFTIEKPIGWEIKEKPRSNVIVQFIGKEGKGLISTINVALINLKEPIENFNGYVEKEIELAESTYDGFRLISKKKNKTSNNYDTWILEISSGKGDNLVRIVEGVVKCNNQKVVIIGCNSLPQFYTKNELIFLHVINSVKC